MTSVYLERDGGSYTVDARGHATGSAELCAAVSALMFALDGYLHNAVGVEIVTERMNPGDARLHWHGGTDDVWLLMLCGFLGLQEAQPDRIRVSCAEI